MIMRTFPIWRVFSARTMSLVWACLVLAALCGCSLFRSDEDGDEDPFDVGAGDGSDPSTPQYIVSLDPSSLRVTESNPIQSIALTVQCAGPDLPPDCDLNQPMWIASDSRVTIADPRSPATTATLSFSFDPEKSIFAGVRRVAAIVVQPTRIPKGLRLAGNRRLEVEVIPNEPERAEDPPSKPLLIVIPSGARPFEANDDRPRFQQFALIYKGPDDDLVDISFADRGDTDRFSLSRPALPIALKNGSTVIFLVTFHPGNTQGQFEVDLQVTTRTLSRTIKIGGNRSF